MQLSLALLVAQDRIRVFAVTSLLSSIGGSIIGLGLLTFVHADAVTYAWGGVVAQGIAMVIGIAATRPRIAGLFDRPTTARAFRLGIPIALGNLSYFVLNAGDRIVIQRMLGPEEVARYQIAYVVGSAVILLLSFTNQAWAPHFAALRDAVARRELAMHARDELYKMLAPVLLAVTLVSPVALPILAPASYRVHELTVVVLIVAVTALPVVASGATGRLLVIERRGVAVGVIAAIAGVVNIAANLVLVPWLGLSGAAVATVVAYVVLAVLQQASLPDRRAWKGPSWRVTVPVGAALAVAVASLFVPQDVFWNWFRFAGALACLPGSSVVSEPPEEGPHDHRTPPAHRPRHLRAGDHRWARALRPRGHRGTRRRRPRRRGLAPGRRDGPRRRGPPALRATRRPPRARDRPALRRPHRVPRRPPLRA